jgi:hypothetical protein
MPPPSSSSDLPGHSPSVPEAFARVKGMFLEMPGTEWTVADAARLAGLDSAVCRAILDALEQTGFLSRRASGAFVRCMARQTARHATVTAGLRSAVRPAP